MKLQLNSLLVNYLLAYLATKNKKQAMIMKLKYDFVSEIRYILAQLDLLDDKTQAHFNLIHGVFFKQPETGKPKPSKMQLKLFQ